MQPIHHHDQIHSSGQVIKKLWTVNTLLYLALVLALLASLKHVAFAFATTNGGDQVEAYISAIAIDLGLLALATGISKRARVKRATWPMWFGVVLFSVISTYANWLAGVVHVTPIVADVGQWGKKLIALRPILLSSVLPLLVIYLSEIVSSDHQNELAIAEREARREARRSGHSANAPVKLPPMAQTDDERMNNLKWANETRETQIEARRGQVLTLMQKGMSRTEIASELGVSSSTIKRDIATLDLTHQNGKGKSTQ